MVQQSGKVYLVGSGPGGVAHLTVLAQQLLFQAEVLVYDALVDSDLLPLVPSTCLKLDVGKRGGQPSTPQAEINRLLIQYCQQGKRVVRLKNGDPFIFGRAAAEIQALRQANCTYEVVPGLSSVLAAPLLAGIPLTDPALSHCFAVLTAHNPDVLDWDALAQLETLVILMGGKCLPEIVHQLRLHGRSLETPIAIIRFAGRPQQQVWQGTLGSIERQTTGETLSPCVIVVGEVIKLRAYLTSQPPPSDAPTPASIAANATLPLQDKTILVTRSVGQSGQFRDRLLELGATVIEMPALEIGPPSSWADLDAAIAQLAEYDWLILTSANAVEYFLERLLHQGKDLRALAPVKIAVVGEKTAQTLKQRGLQPDFIPPEFVADALAAHFPGDLAASRILFPRVESGGRDALVKDLTSRGASITEVAAYESGCPATIDPIALEALRNHQVDVVTFASSKTVKHFCQLLQQAQTEEEWQSWLTGVLLASIGPQTSKTCLEQLGRVDMEATEYTLDGLAQAIAHYFAELPS